MNDARPTGKDAEKFKVFDELLIEEYILAHVNTRLAGVILPKSLLSQPTVTLKLSRQFVKPLFLGKDTVRAELLFNGEYFACSVPWEAIWGVTGIKGDGKVWVDAVPAGVLQDLAKILPEEETPQTSAAPLQLTLGDTSYAPEKPKIPPKGGHLRRIK